MAELTDMLVDEYKGWVIFVVTTHTKLKITWNPFSFFLLLFSDFGFASCDFLSNPFYVFSCEIVLNMFNESLFFLFYLLTPWFAQLLTLICPTFFMYFIITVFYHYLYFFLNVRICTTFSPDLLSVYSLMLLVLCFFSFAKYYYYYYYIIGIDECLPHAQLL